MCQKNFLSVAEKYGSNVASNAFAARWISVLIFLVKLCCTKKEKSDRYALKKVVSTGLAL